MKDTFASRTFHFNNRIDFYSKIVETYEFAFYRAPTYCELKKLFTVEKDR